MSRTSCDDAKLLVEHVRPGECGVMATRLLYNPTFLFLDAFLEWPIEHESRRSLSRAVFAASGGFDGPSSRSAQCKEHQRKQGKGIVGTTIWRQVC